MSNEITAEEFHHFQSVLEDVNQLCFKMWTGWMNASCSACLIDPKTKFWSSRDSIKSKIWPMACIAWMELTECHLDPQQMVYACQDFLNSSRNADPAQDFKASL